MRRSFALRLAITFAVVGITAAALTALLVNVSFNRQFTGYIERTRTDRQTELVSGLSESYSRMGGWDTNDLRSLAGLALMDGGSVRLIDQDGSVVWEPSATPAGSSMAELHRAMTGGGTLGPEQEIEVRVDGRPVGTLAVRLPEPGVATQDLNFRSSVNQGLLYGGLVAGLLALLLGIVLARRTTRPARDLTRAAQALAGGDRSQRVDQRGPDELGEMADAFNRMADTIEEEDRLRRLFATDVAHELRTPLAILRTQVEALQDGVSPASPEVFASLHEETMRLTRLVADLETLASAEAARFSLRPAQTDLGSLLTEVAREYAGPYEAKGVALEAALAPVWAHVDPLRVSQIASNLLSNALKFTPPGAAVHLSLDADDHLVRIAVRDEGPGIPGDELPHVFERFWRGREVKAAGSGIGLTVVRQLAQAHGGAVEVESGGRGATFRVYLPTRPPGDNPPSLP